MIHLTAINIYPLKSARAIPLPTGELDDFGLSRDRRWMVVDSDGRFVSQREAHRLALVDVGLDDGDLLLGARGMPELRVSPPSPQSSMVPVRIWGDVCNAQEGPPDAAGWLRRVLGQDARLVYMPHSTFRPVNPDFVPQRRRVSFADAYPLLLIGEASLEDLNRRMETPILMNRFRPNLVVSGSDPYAEDQWTSIQLSGIVFDVVKPCDRCVTTTIDQATGEAGREPLRTLATYRKWNGQVYFGQNLLHRTKGSIKVGDPIVL